VYNCTVNNTGQELVYKAKEGNMTSLKNLLNGYSNHPTSYKNEISQQSSMKKPTNHNTSHN
jgi:hypothetical protein